MNDDDTKNALEFFSNTGNVLVNGQSVTITTDPYLDGTKTGDFVLNNGHWVSDMPLINPMSPIQYPGQLANPLDPTPQEIMWEITNLQYRMSDLYNKMEELKKMAKKFTEPEEKGDRRKLI